PDDFTGSIGSFKMTAAADKTAVELNQPVSVTIRINGTGNVKSVSEPTIPTSDDFRVYRASTSENISKLNDRLGGTKLYEEVFIPRRPGTLRIPALRFSYFDPERGRYEALATQPIVVNVVKPEGYAASADIPYSAPDLTIGSRASDIRYIKQDLGDTTPMGKVLLFTPLYIAVNGLPVLVLAATVLIRRRRERLTADIGYARSRKASKTARRKLARAKSRARVEHAGEFFAEVASALTSYIADKLNVSPHGLTSDRIAALLRERSADEILIREVDELLRTCDFARYAPAAIAQAEIDAALARAEQTMTRMEEVNFA
ncbi:MAG TPA: BatD family protein, partial [Candidatus Deferrimicrobium sp.]|nr:BatD family protein [Candidatus Deferrimicrobium sp.]